MSKFGNFRARRHAIAPLLVPTLLLYAGVCRPASAQSFDIVYGFTGGPDGALINGVTLDAAGNLYGTATNGGNLLIINGILNGYGTVFKLTPAGGLTLLHTFAGPDTNGAIGRWVLPPDTHGNVYGAANWGGDLNCQSGTGCGVVFKINAKGKYSVVYAFQGSSDGEFPDSLIEDAAGNLYGTTNGEYLGLGTIFKIDTHGTFTTLHDFTGSDGNEPVGTLALDSAGNLYGATSYGGSSGSGNVYELSPNATLTTLYSFTGQADGANPGGVVRDAAGNLWGVAENGGDANSDGVVWKIPAGGSYGVVYTFTGGNDGGGPQGSVALDTAGNLYGTASWGGTSASYQACSGSVYSNTNGCGVVFELNPTTGQETVLHNFTGYADGAIPVDLVIGSNGHLYGTTRMSGPFPDIGLTQGIFYGGTVFEVVP